MSIYVRSSSYAKNPHFVQLTKFNKGKRQTFADKMRNCEEKIHWKRTHSYLVLFFKKTLPRLRGVVPIPNAYLLMRLAERDETRGPLALNRLPGVKCNC